MLPVRRLERTTRLPNSAQDLTTDAWMNGRQRQQESHPPLLAVEAVCLDAAVACVALLPCPAFSDERSPSSYTDGPIRHRVGVPAWHDIIL